MPSQVKSQKRIQIAKANRNIFFIVAGASLVVGFCLVSSYHLIRRIHFRAHVIGEAQETARILARNADNIETIAARIRALEYDQALMYVAQGDDMNTLRVIADALPAVDNPAALGASMSDKILGIPEVRLESLRISTSNRQVGGSATPGNIDAATATASTTDFDFRITSANASPVNRETDVIIALRNIERSIRSINIESFRLSFTTRLELTARATAFYTNPVTTTLNDRVLSPLDATRGRN